VHQKDEMASTPCKVALVLLPLFFLVYFTVADNKTNQVKQQSYNMVSENRVWSGKMYISAKSKMTLSVSNIDTEAI